ncbi:hypothetical protein L6452_08251 [Arctium lappa]|uniref:Uncharacterized protein n=1 Tax=Arctium lappa TaxID=4217 RepID=A0ACB9DHD6_ARCLA|nr:hypothetical protein L6452_08251 [Arctium lappa]
MPDGRSWTPTSLSGLHGRAKDIGLCSKHAMDWAIELIQLGWTSTRYASPYASWTNIGCSVFCTSVK